MLTERKSTGNRGSRGVAGGAKGTEQKHQGMSPGDSDAFRSDCFGKQRKFLSATFIPLNCFLMLIQFFLMLFGKFDKAMTFLSIAATSLFLFGLADLSGFVTLSVQTSELKTTAAYAIGGGLLHAATCFWNPSSLAARVLLQGHYGVSGDVGGWG
uniref:Uncharacterized protein n=1 Tax=Chromera velia CCMP2878 TaxID=1169474 RepID=A0A0G4GBU7_9ALVE|eukprot:Cvel_21185.t1-p1 / transcript=Cvel_21185.t1 / gene=Cvel_21185 / organism=Chromera_velia_CCMP2878 / gene_product=hypothetical protein / transcript_product=hypothetical protein / location=Cvel_scaffold1966:26626-27179(-) / protein_length=154 / sequence_SO=supercontig / SO=protein_coding / is_pseudo=false